MAKCFTASRRVIALRFSQARRSKHEAMTMIEIAPQFLGPELNTLLVTATGANESVDKQRRGYCGHLN